MGVAFAAAFACVLEAANAGETLGPRAVVNAVSKANIFLGAADALTRLNIFLLRPPAEVHLHSMGRCRRMERLDSRCFAVVTPLLKVCEFAAAGFRRFSRGDAWFTSDRPRSE